MPPKIKVVVQITVPEREQFFVMMSYPGEPRELFHAIQSLGVEVEYTAVFELKHEYDAFDESMRVHSAVMTEQTLGENKE